MELLRKYGVPCDVYFPLVKADAQDFATSSDYTHASGDVKISQDGGAAATATNAPSAITMGHGAMWKLTLTATEMEAALIMVTIIDGATKAVEDQAILLSTYGHASAQHTLDLDTTVPTVAEIADAVWDELLTGTAHNTATSAGRRLRQLGDAVAGAVSDASPSATVFDTNLSSAVDDFYNDQIMRFTSGDLAGQTRVILDYDGTNKTVTVDEAWTSAPADGDMFDVVPSHVHPDTQIAEAVLDTALSEPTGVFAWASVTLRTAVAWMAALSRNKLTQDSTETVMRNDADDADLASAPISESMGTFTRGEWQ